MMNANLQKGNKKKHGGFLEDIQPLQTTQLTNKQGHMQEISEENHRKSHGLIMCQVLPPIQTVNSYGIV